MPGKHEMKSLAPTIFFAVLAIAMGLYFVAGKSGTGTTASPHTAVAANESAGKMQLGSVESMVGGLEERLRQQPDDGKGWLLLAKSYRHLGRMDEARDAYKKAEALGNDDPAVAAQLFGLESSKANDAMQMPVAARKPPQ